jgi:hypothetical protein
MAGPLSTAEIVHFKAEASSCCARSALLAAAFALCLRLRSAIRRPQPAGNTVHRMNFFFKKKKLNRYLYQNFLFCPHIQYRD